MAQTMHAAPKHGKYGKLGPQFPERLKSFKSYLTTALAPPPAGIDDYDGVASWPMFGNDQYGDCTMAAAAHGIQCWNAVAKTADPVPAEKDVVAEYLKLTHGRDSGLVEANVLKTWRRAGLWGNRIVGYAPVNVHDQITLKQTIQLFGLTYVGIQVPANAEAQFEARQPWTLVEGWQNQQIVGGHAIPFVGYDAEWLYAVTWGAVQKVAWDWWQTYGDEAWAILPQAYKEAGTVDNIDFAALESDLSQV